MFAKEILMGGTVISSIHHKIQDDKMQTRISCSGTLNPILAAKLGAQDLVFAKNGTPKGGFSSLALDTGCAAFRALFQPDAALKHSFELVSGDSTDRYVIKRQEGGVLKLELRLNYHGNPHEAIAYALAVGGAEAELKIVPLQSEIDTTKSGDEQGDEDTEDGDDEDDSQDDLFEPASLEPARHPLITGRGKNRKLARM